MLCVDELAGHLSSAAAAPVSDAIRDTRAPTLAGSRTMVQRRKEPLRCYR